MATEAEPQTTIEELQAMLAISSTLYDLSRDLNAVRAEADLLEVLVRSEARNGADGVVLMYLYLDPGGAPQYAQAVASWISGGARLEASKRYLLRDYPLAHLCLSSPNTPQLIENILEDPRVDSGTRTALERLDVLSVALIPLKRGSSWIGLLLFAWEGIHRFTAREVTIYTHVTNLVTPVVESVRLVQNLEQAVVERTQALSEANRKLERDIARRSEVDQASQRYAERLRILHEIDQSILAASSPETIALATLGHLRQLVPSQRTFVAELLQDREMAVLAAESDGQIRIDLSDRLPLLRGEIERRREPYGVQDLNAIPVRSPWQELLYREGIRAYLMVPLLFQYEPIGTLSLESREPGAFTAEHVEAAAQVAALLAVAVRQARLNDTLQQRANELALANRAAEEARFAAETANRAKSIFLANISHELRTPLNAILGFAQLMTDAPELTSNQRENLRIIEHSGEHLLGLINDILELSKIEAGQIRLYEHDFDLLDMLRDLEEMFRLRAQNKGLALNVLIADDVPRYVRTDQSKLRQVLINLLGNAVKFTDQGQVALRLQVASTGTDAAERRLYFSVEDTGPGIGPEEMESVFAPFEQAALGRQHQEGTGLGVPISQQFVRLLGGELTVTSQVGLGSIFSFDIVVLPVESASPSVAPTGRQFIGVAPGQPSRRLLIVDDEDASRMLLRKILMPCGFELREAANGQDALDIWLEWNPDLVWMDIRMPVLDGYEATRRIKMMTESRKTVVIALTAAAFEDEESRAAAAGCDGLIRKPFHRSEIYGALTEHLGVHFVYTDAELEPETEPVLLAGAAGDSSPVVALQNAVPDEWPLQLRRATIEADLDLIQALIDQVKLTAPELGRVLGDLAHNYDHDGILNLIDRYLDPGAPVSYADGGLPLAPGPARRLY